jgi:signal transduction histidine kinase
MFQRLDRDVARIDVLMGQLLTLSHLESGLSSADREDVNLSEFVEWAAADSNFEAQASGKSVSFRSAGEFRIKDADPQALRSACENVIRNAARFPRPGTNVEVVLEIDRSTPKSLAVLSVRDHGPGVPEESLEAIFQPFYRIGSDTQELDGNGLGLAIAGLQLHRLIRVSWARRDSSKLKARPTDGCQCVRMSVGCLYLNSPLANLCALNGALLRTLALVILKSPLQILT